jgi:hypothetical protein
MDGLRNFVAFQVKKVQEELATLLLIHPDEKRDDVVPSFALDRLQDDHSKARKTGPSFKTHDMRTSCKQVVITGESQILWNKRAIQAYFADVDSYLERLLLLFHTALG